jgi:hypothetical protein
MTPLDNITLNERCSPIPDNHCVDLYFNTTILYKNFSIQYTDLINKLFDREDGTNSKTQNTIYIHIEYDTLDRLSLDTFQSFDELENRSYYGISFELKNRDNRLILPLNDDIKNMTLSSLQINIYCGSKGLYQYNYVLNFQQQQPLVESLKCEIPTTTSSTMTKNPNEIFTTKKSRYKFVLIFSLIGGGSLIPCFLLACCLYILCKRNIEKNNYNNQRRDSLSSDSISSDNSLFEIK